MPTLIMAVARSTSLCGFDGRFCFGPPRPADAPFSPRTRQDADRAIASYRALRHHLGAGDGSGLYREAMHDYADRVWATRRGLGTGLFAFGADGVTEAIQQAAMIQIYAVLGWDPAQYPIVY